MEVEGTETEEEKGKEGGGVGRISVVDDGKSKLVGEIVAGLTVYIIR